MSKVKPPEPFIDHFGREYIGPCSLDEALAAAEIKDGIRMAISSPEGRLIVICFEDGDEQIRYCREVNNMSGHGGSIMGTGKWREMESVPKSISWRPA
jgi:hypothetical protein